MTKNGKTLVVVNKLQKNFTKFFPRSDQGIINMNRNGNFGKGT